MKHIFISVLSILFIGAIIGGCITPPPETKPVERAKVEPRKRPLSTAVSADEMRHRREEDKRRSHEIIQEQKKFVMDWQKCAIVEYNHYMKDLRAQLKNKPKFDLEKLTGHALGESSEFRSPREHYALLGFGQGCNIGDRFLPFRRMHRLFGAAPGMPMYWCHMGRQKAVEPDQLVVPGDYAHEAQLIKKRIEDTCNLVMTDDPGKGYLYEDEYVTVMVGTNSSSGRPLFVDVRDKLLTKGNYYILRRLEYWKNDAWKAWDPKMIQELVREFDSEE